MKKVLFINVVVLLVLLGIVTLVMYGAGLSKLENFYQTDYYQPDSLAVFVHQPNYTHTFDWAEHPKGEITFQTNNLGFRNNNDVNSAKEKNEVRILITGDSHTDGVVYNEESMAAVLQQRLNEYAGEMDADSTYLVLNGGHGFYSFKNYHGLLEKYLDLGLDHFIIVVFTGNDFRETLLYEEESKKFGHVMQNMAFRLERKMRFEWGHAIPLNQGIDQEFYFYSYPAEKEKALETARHYMTEIRELCIQQNIDLTIALLPSKTEVDAAFSNQVAEELELPKKVTQQNEWLIENFHSWLESEKFNVLDLSIPLSGTDKKMYWDRDLHINHTAHKEIGEYLYQQKFQRNR